MKNTSVSNVGETPLGKAGSSNRKIKVVDLNLSNLNISVFSLSRRNKEKKYQKPIEDYHIADSENKIFILMDGATRFVRDGQSYPDPSPAAIAAKTIAHRIHEYISLNNKHNLDKHDLINKAIRTANSTIKELNDSNFLEIDYLENDYANACGIAALIKDETFYYSFLGDPQGYLIRAGKISPFTVTQTAKIDELYLSKENDQKCLIEFRKYVCSSVRNKKGHSYSFGSLTGEDGALDLLEYGKIKLERGDRILLTSDGILPLFEKNPSLYLETNYESLFNEMELLESAENIRSDDKTLIAIDVA